MTDLLDDLCTGLIAQLGQDPVALSAVTDPGANFHEFVIVERAVQFADQVRADTGLTDQNDRLSIVS